MKTNKDILNELSSFSWKEVNQMIKNGDFASTKKQLSKDTFLFIAKEENLETVVELAYTSLQKVDPEQVIIEHAVKVAEEMQKFARKMVNEMNKTEDARGE